MRLIDVVSAPWAITPDMFAEVQGIYARHMRGEKIDIESLEARVGAPLVNQRSELRVEDGVAVIALDGVLAKRMNLFMRISGGTSTQIVAGQIRQAVADPNVKAILLHVDSPGGTVDGTQELADLIFNSRASKPVVALADGMMASAAYWAASAAQRVLIGSDTAKVGSIGVVATHTDYSRYEKNAGIDTIEITAGRFKKLETESGSLTREGRAVIQAEADEIYRIFVEQVARNRGTTIEDVHARMADGRVFIGRKAIEAGLVDGVATFDAALAEAAALAANFNLTALDGDSKTVAIVGDVPMTITVESLKKEHPEVANALLAEGREAGRADGLSAGKAEGRLEGANVERERIKAVLAQRMPGHEALVESLAFDGKTSGPEAAVQVLNAERSRGAQRLNALREDAGNAHVPVAGDPPANPKDIEQKIDPVQTAKRARDYIDAQAKQGRRVTEAEAVDHVLSEG